MNTSPSNKKEAPRGYLSEEHKRKFTLTAGILGALFFIVQFILPFVIVVAIMAGMIFSEDFWLKEAELRRGAFWNNQIWYVEKLFSPKTPDYSPATLKFFKIADKGSPKSAEICPIDNPWLLAGNDRLWIISSSAIGFYQNGKISVISEAKRLGDILRPFLYENLPAVIEDRPGGLTLSVFDGGAWQKKLSFKLNLQEKQGEVRGNLQVVPSEGALHLFLKYGDTLYYREGLPTPEADDPDAWQPVSDVNGNWFALLLRGAPTVFFRRHLGTGSKIVGLRLEEKAWKSFFSHDAGMTTKMGVYPLGQSGTFGLLLQSFPGYLRLVEVDEGKVVKEIRLGGSGFPFSHIFKIMMVGFYAPTLIFPLILAIVLSSLMRKHRVPEYEAGPMKMPFGSLTRRALSQVIDLFVLGAPAIAGALFLFPIFDMEKMINSGRMLSGFGLMLGELIWALACLFVFSFLEGRWGATPGKWAVGIRVLGTDFRPCGFGRALVRNLLKFIDGFFNFMVGILLAALSENCQRLGDMAANTVVIDAREKLTLDPD
jgi:uncharacterized RDD family membrane protein YckC